MAEVELTSFLPAINMHKRLFSTEYGAKHAATEYFRKCLNVYGLKKNKDTEISRENSEKRDDDESPEKDS